MLLASLSWQWLLPLFHLAVGFTSVSVQTRTRLVPPRPKAWDLHDYLTANYHKTGVYLTNKIHNAIFTILGAEDGAMGALEYACYYDTSKPLCWNTHAPILRFTDGFNASWRGSHTGSKPMLVAGSVRDPLEMVASAYCYHHEGKELANYLIPVAELLVLGLEPGTELTAKYMLPIVEWMASVFADPDNATLRLTFEEFTKSSESFDASVNRLLDHYFGAGDDLISESERSQIREAVKQFDTHRNPMTTYKSYNTHLSLSTDHSSDPECKRNASKAVLKMDPILLKKYQELQRRLGYPVVAQ